MAYETIIYEKKEGVGKITMNRPAQRNSLSIQLIREVQAVINEIEKDEEAKVVVFTGNPECFCAGADLKEKPPPTFLLEANNLINMIEDLGKPTIAAISGWCLAGGLELAMACDLRVASETARIGDWHIRIGVIGGAGATTRLPRIVGVAKAKELIFTGEALDGKEACRIGLVNQVFPVEKYLDGAIELARKIAAFKPVTLRKAKESINMGLSMDVHQSLHFSDRCAAEVRAALGADAGRKAFAERKQT